MGRPLSRARFALTRPTTTSGNVLVVKLGALGNIVLSLAAFGAIRRHHAGARISVLTSEAFAPWLRTFPYFDDVIVDPRPARFDIPGLRRLARTLAEGKFARVYDLQTSARSSRYFHLFPANQRPEWSGIAYGCALPDRNPNRNALHDAERQRQQLAQAGITEFPPADLSWCKGDIARFALPPDFAVLIPGSSPGRPQKRWPAERFESLARSLRDSGVAPVAIGTAAEAPLAAQIPSAIDLTGRTAFGDLADLARAAQFCVGNDTGPAHLIATAGCPSVTLFSRESDPSLCAPVGPSTRVLRSDDLADLPVGDVLSAIKEMCCDDEPGTRLAAVRPVTS